MTVQNVLCTLRKAETLTGVKIQMWLILGALHKPADEFSHVFRSALRLAFWGIKMRSMSI